MLDKPIEGYTYDETGTINGVTSQGETVKTKCVIADPTYFPDKVKKFGQVGRSFVCLCTQICLSVCSSFVLTKGYVKKGDV